jgi:hypothetical protein
MRTSAQIDEGTTSVNGALGAIGDSLLNEVLLVLAVVEHLKKLLLGHLETLERLLLLDNAVGQLFESLLVLFSNRLSEKVLADTHRSSRDFSDILSHVGHIIVESRRILSRGAVAEVASETSLRGLSKNMGR